MDERQKLEALGVIQLNVASSEQQEQRVTDPSGFTPGEDHIDTQSHRQVPRPATVTSEEEEEENLSSSAASNQKSSPSTAQPESSTSLDSPTMHLSQSPNSKPPTTNAQLFSDGRTAARPPSRDRWGFMDQHGQPGFPPHSSSRPGPPFDPQMAYAAGNRHSWHDGPHVSPGAAVTSSMMPNSPYSNFFPTAPRPEGGSFRSWSPAHATPYPPASGLSSGSHGYINFQNSGLMNISPTFSQASLNSQSRPPVPISPTMSSHLAPPARGIGGYPLLAEKLAGVNDGIPVVPMYRSFAALNHRLLLYLQDDLVCLEGELRKLEATEADSRIGPASRRQETHSAPETYARKQELLGKIGTELCRYNQLMASFRKTRGFLVPSPVEIKTYRNFLAHSNPIVEEETRFLDNVDDLVCLDIEPEAAGQPVMDGDRTPMPERKEVNGFPFRPNLQNANSPPRTGRPPPQRRIEQQQPNQVAQLVLAVFAAVILPLLLFVIVPGFMARLVIVLVVGVSFVVISAQTGLLKLLVKQGGISDAVIYLGAYGGVMAVLAGTVR